jgi:hypothetical protein
VPEYGGKQELHGRMIHRLSGTASATVTAEWRQRVDMELHNLYLHQIHRRGPNRDDEMSGTCITHGDDYKEKVLDIIYTKQCTPLYLLQ